MSGNGASIYDHNAQDVTRVYTSHPAIPLPPHGALFPCLPGAVQRGASPILWRPIGFAVVEAEERTGVALMLVIALAPFLTGNLNRRTESSTDTRIVQLSMSDAFIPNVGHHRRVLVACTTADG